MKLSEDARRYADALLSKATYEIALWIEEDPRRIRALRTQSDPKLSLMTSITRSEYGELLRD